MHETRFTVVIFKICRQLLGVLPSDPTPNARRARLVPGWATVFERVYHLGM